MEGMEASCCDVRAAQSRVWRQLIPTLCLRRKILILIVVGVEQGSAHSSQLDNKHHLCWIAHFLAPLLLLLLLRAMTMR